MYIKYFKEAILLQIPLIINPLLESFVDTINIIFMGHFSDITQLASLAVAAFTLIILINGIVIGLTQRYVAIISQTYEKGDINLCRDYIDKLKITSIIIVLTMYTILFNLKDLLVALGYDENIAYYCQIYFYYMLPGIIFYNLYCSIRTILQATQKIQLTFYVFPIILILQIVWDYIFIVNLQYGIVGAAIASNITYFLLYIYLTLIIAKLDKIKDMNQYIRKKSFIGLTKFMKNSLPSVFLRLSDFYSILIINMIGATISVVASAAIGLTGVIISIFQVQVVSVCLSGYIMIGNQVGKGFSKTSKFYSLILLAESIIFCLIISLILVIYHYQIASLQTSYDTVLTYYSEMLLISFPLYATSINIKQYLGSTFILLHKAKDTIVGIIFFYIFAFPLALILAFKCEMEIQGLLYGVAIGNILVIIFYLYLLYSKYDWQSIVEEIQVNLQHDALQVHVKEQNYIESIIQKGNSVQISLISN